MDQVRLLLGKVILIKVACHCHFYNGNPENMCLGIWDVWHCFVIFVDGGGGNTGQEAGSFCV